MVVYEDLEFFVRKNRVEHPKERLDLSRFVQERIAFFDDLLTSKEITVVQKIEEGLIIHFSRLELSRIIDNTLSNAIKYSPSHTKITVSLHDKQQILLSIADQGRGIKDAGKVFERYYRGDKISGGFGIGLSIVKAICDKNRVNVEVVSSREKGTTFMYYFKK